MKKYPWTLRIGIGLTGFIFLIALLAIFWTPYDVDNTEGMRLEGSSLRHLLGTDRLGQDLLSQIMDGSKIALLVGSGAVVISFLIGVTLGITAAISPKWIDDTFASIFDTLIAFPTLLLAMLIVATRGPSLSTAILSIGIASSAPVSRLSRILAKRILSAQYITAARISGGTTWSIIRRHLLPNMWPTLMVSAAVIYGVAVLTEAGLSYLGLGAPPPSTSWGNLLREAQSTVITQPLGALAPGIAIMTLVLGINFIADGLRDYIDPTLRSNR